MLSAYPVVKIDIEGLASRIRDGDLLCAAIVVCHQDKIALSVMLLLNRQDYAHAVLHECALCASTARENRN